MEVNVEVNTAITVPNEVALAFDKHIESCKNMSEDTLNAVFLAIPYSVVHGPAKVLKNFASNHPTTYLKAIANGYKPESDIVAAGIRRGYEGAVLRMQDKTDADGFAKEAIEEVVHYLGGDEILADISNFNRYQLNKNNA